MGSPSRIGECAGAYELHGGGPDAAAAPVGVHEDRGERHALSRLNIVGIAEEPNDSRGIDVVERLVAHCDRAAHASFSAREQHVGLLGSFWIAALHLIRQKALDGVAEVVGVVVPGHVVGGVELIEALPARGNRSVGGRHWDFDRANFHGASVPVLVRACPHDGVRFGEGNTPLNGASVLVWRYESFN